MLKVNFNTQAAGYAEWKAAGRTMLDQLSVAMQQMFALADGSGALVGEMGIKFPDDVRDTLERDAALITDAARRDRPDLVIGAPLVIIPVSEGGTVVYPPNPPPMNEPPRCQPPPVSEAEVFDAAVAAVRAAISGALSPREAATICMACGVALHSRR